jgi:hypothetical protein
VREANRQLPDPEASRQLRRGAGQLEQEATACRPVDSYRAPRDRFVPAIEGLHRRFLGGEPGGQTPRVQAAFALLLVSEHAINVVRTVNLKRVLNLVDADQIDSDSSCHRRVLLAVFTVARRCQRSSVAPQHALPSMVS